MQATLFDKPAAPEQVIRFVKPAAMVDYPALLKPVKADSIEAKVEEAIAVVEGIIEEGYSVTFGFSGGKDSSCTTMLGLEAIRRCKVRGVRQATHFVMSASTGVESPAMENHLLCMHDEINAFIAAHDLPVEVHMVKPSLASCFVVTTIGRGTLPRFPENSKGKRTCSVDWKVKPQQRLAKKLSAIAEANGFRETVAVIGTRHEESIIRSARMTERNESATKPVRDSQGRLTLSLIADWTLDDVWSLLQMAMEPETARFPLFTDGHSIHRLFELYRDANEGTCGIVLGDGGTKAACGARFGCAICTVGGQRDKSMESMLMDPKYGYMNGLNAFRNLLVATQHDYSKRELVGRTVSNAGYVPVRPDVYSLAFRKELLRYAITLDVLEEERAEQTAADIATGKLERTRENLMMTEPQFQLVSLEQLMAIEWNWGLHHYGSNAFQAIEIYHDVRTLGRRYKVPTVAYVEKTPVPAKRWFMSGAYNAQVPTDGLRDYQLEQWGPYLHPERSMHKCSIKGETSVWFVESEHLTVNAEKAYDLVEMQYPEHYMTMRMHGALEGSRFLLGEEIVTLPKGMAAKYQFMAKRGQYFAHLAERLNLSPAELDEHLKTHSISDEEHKARGGDDVENEDDIDGDSDNQMDLFGFN